MRGENFGALMITHYQRLLNYITPDKVHVMYAGKVVKSGGPELAKRLEEEGYEWVKEEFGFSPNNLINTVSMRCSSIDDENETFIRNSKFHQVGGKSYDN